MTLIYIPQGRAYEYSQLALNLYSGCDHICDYCYAPAALRTTPELFAIPKLRADKNLIRTLGKEAEILRKKKEKTPILLCFSCDPYMKFDEQHKLTRQALQVLLGNDLNVVILSKGGKRVLRDLDLFRTFPSQIKVGATLVFADDNESLKVEKGAAPTSERIETLRVLHDVGIKTFVSLEPVYTAEDSLALIDMTHEFVDEYKVGVLNYNKEISSRVNWKKFAQDVTQKLIILKRDYYIKNDLKKYLEG